MAFESCRALLFDVFGTCVDWRTSITRAVAEAAERAGVEMDAEPFADAWRGLYQPSMEAVRRGDRPFAILDQLHRESLDHLLDQGGVGDLFDEAARAELTKAWRRLEPWPDAPEGLRRLESARLIAPCSNGNIALMAHLSKYAGLPWNLILGAEPTQAYKPMRQVYLGSAALLDLEPEQCMMVAAHNSDLFAARDAGLLCAFVPRPTEHGPGQTTDLQPMAGWDIVAKDFNDLADQLSSPVPLGPGS